MSAATWAGGAAATAAVLYALPSLTAVSVVRRCTPRLAGRGRSDHVALTFDDGPDAAGTPVILDILEELQVTATFFVLGQQVAGQRELARRLVDGGHEIGLHGWHHRNSLTVSPRGLRASLMRALDEITDTTGVRPRFYRPPYGIASAATFWASSSLGLTPVLWDACGRDWEAGATAGSVLGGVRRDVRGGSTILLHDSDCTSAPGSWRATAGALRPLVCGLRAQGLAVGPLRDHGVGQSQPGEHLAQAFGELRRGVLRFGNHRAVNRGQRGGRQRMGIRRAHAGVSEF